MKKRLIAAMMSAMVIAGTVIPVSGETVNVSYREPNTYEITIPTQVTLNDTTETTQTISAASVNIEPNKTIDVTITSGVSNGTVTLERTNDTATTVQSTLSLTSGGTSMADGTVVARFTGNSNTPVSGTGTIYYSAIRPTTGTEVLAGTYTGTMVFTIEAPAKE